MYYYYLSTYNNIRIMCIFVLLLLIHTIKPHSITEKMSWKLKYNVIEFPIIEQLIQSEFNIYGLIESVENWPTHKISIILC